MASRRSMNTMLLAVVAGLLVVGALVAVPVLFGRAGLTMLGLILGGLVLLLGTGLRSLGANEARLAAVHFPRLELTPLSKLGKKHRGQRVRVRGSIAGEVEGPFSGERVAYVLADVTRVHRAPHKQLPLPSRQRPKKKLELTDGAGSIGAGSIGAGSTVDGSTVDGSTVDGAVRVAISFGDRLRGVLSSHSWGPEQWHPGNGERDRRLEAVFKELYPQLEVSQGSKVHYQLREQWLRSDDTVTVTGQVKQVDELSKGRRVELVAPEGGELLLTNLDDEEIVALGRRSGGARRWGRLALVVGGCAFFAGLLGILFG